MAEFCENCPALGNCTAGQKLIPKWQELNSGVDTVDTVQFFDQDGNASLVIEAKESRKTLESAIETCTGPIIESSKFFRKRTLGCNGIGKSALADSSLENFLSERAHPILETMQIELKEAN